MSNFEKDQYINYQRIEDNLAVVRKRQVTVILQGREFVACVA